MKSILLVVLAMFMLAGCGTDKGTSIGTQQGPSDQDKDFVPGENKTDGEEPTMDKSDIPDADGAADDNDQK
ncbi:hypothetical protein [Paenisporosarcina sp. HGH0030]